VHIKQTDKTKQQKKVVNTGEAKSRTPTAQHVNYMRPGTFPVVYKITRRAVLTNTTPSIHDK